MVIADWGNFLDCQTLAPLQLTNSLAYGQKHFNNKQTWKVLHYPVYKPSLSGLCIDEAVVCGANSNLAHLSLAVHMSTILYSYLDSCNRRALCIGFAQHHFGGKTMKHIAPIM